MSISKERFHMVNASELDRVIYRFFMIPKEVQMLFHQIRTRGNFVGSKWGAMLAEALRLQELKKVIFVQPYSPQNPDENKRPFILLIQDEWMLQVALRFSCQNSWAMDSTFKTNIYGLPLYGAVLPNQTGIGIPIWLMLCSIDVGTNQEKVALELTFKMIFARSFLLKRRRGWKAATSRMQSFAMLVHVKKAWDENLLPQVPKDKHDDVYNCLSNLMHATREDIFDARYDELLQVYQAHENIRWYVSIGWCGSTCMWRSRWPRFGRLFQHGNEDTKNLVEQLWQYVKYTLLNAKINKSLLVLFNALVGDLVHGTYIGGTLLECFKQKQEIVDSGSFSRFGSSKQHTAKLVVGESILKRFEADPRTLKVIEREHYSWVPKSCSINLS
ncbi:hypothetical protein GOP47_0020910 [Adiantum capillus-veneris]|uniref:Uncharacterized protein n=1 Tax=Adiantum capillus-veneris TaxID=13818 RepID=A0A9D4Z7X5_ADICA|nr:hypothetical protein GOP47_0020910 [Adiantum capillus-veneris]